VVPTVRCGSECLSEVTNSGGKTDPVETHSHGLHALCHTPFWEGDKFASLPSPTMSTAFACGDSAAPGSADNSPPNGAQSYHVTPLISAFWKMKLLPPPRTNQSMRLALHEATVGDPTPDPPGTAICCHVPPPKAVPAQSPAKLSR
jgi:hypothetical protein